MARLGLLALISLFATACAPEGTDVMDDPSVDPGEDNPLDLPVDDVDDSAPPADPLNLSFEFPVLADGEMGRPEAWSSDERQDARSYAYADIDGADHGSQYLVLEVQNAGSAWVTSPELAVLEEGVATTLTFAIRSDCSGSVLTLFAGASTSGFAVLPTSASWADVSFSITPDADQVGRSFTAELLVDASSACALEIDDVRVR